MQDSKILVVDDDLMIRDMLYDFLQEKGYDVVSAADSSSAITAVNSRKFDAIILDFKLPEVDGITLMARVKQKYPKIPIIMITGYPSESSRDQAYQSGAAAFIEKPFKVTKLVATLKRAIRESKRA
ncbi:MAG: response regulator [candidate division Zixibacteria bacterium]|nr:response regulator [candidate division Zixibacteria bacterium]